MTVLTWGSRLGDLGALCPGGRGWFPGALQAPWRSAGPACLVSGNPLISKALSEVPSSATQELLPFQGSCLSPGSLPKPSLSTVISETRYHPRGSVRFTRKRMPRRAKGKFVPCSRSPVRMLKVAVDPRGNPQRPRASDLPTESEHLKRVTSPRSPST